MTSPSTDQPLVLGRREYVDFPAWGLERVRAKIDTGAYSSCIDVHGYELHHDDEGGLLAHLQLAVGEHRRSLAVVVPVVRIVAVTSSTGTRERRPLLHVPVRFGPVSRTIRLTVTNRAGRSARMLLGREALGGFLVDVRHSYLLDEQRAGRGIGT